MYFLYLNVLYGKFNLNKKKLFKNIPLNKFFLINKKLKSKKLIDKLNVKLINLTQLYKKNIYQL